MLQNKTDKSNVLQRNNKSAFSPKKKNNDMEDFYSASKKENENEAFSKKLFD